MNARSGDGLDLLVDTDAQGRPAALRHASRRAAVVVFFDKFMLAAVLGAIAFGFFLRLIGRGRVQAAAPVPVPMWSRALSAVLAAVEVALLVGSNKLPCSLRPSWFRGMALGSCTRRVRSRLSAESAGRSYAFGRAPCHGAVLTDQSARTHNSRLRLRRSCWWSGHSYVVPHERDA